MKTLEFGQAVVLPKSHAPFTENALCNRSIGKLQHTAMSNIYSNTSPRRDNARLRPLQILNEGPLVEQQHPRHIRFHIIAA